MSSLDKVHLRAGAVMAQRDGLLLPASYGDPQREYSAVREDGAGLMDLSSRGRIQVSGSEAIPFLNGLITNDMKTLEENRWMAAIFPNVQGRFVAAIRVIREVSQPDGPTVFLLDTEPATHERVLKTIERFTLAGDFVVNDVTGSTAQLSVQGAKAATILGRVFGPNAVDLARDGVATLRWNDTEVLIIRCSHTGEDGFDLIIAEQKAAALWETIVLEGAEPIGFEALEMLRIEAGIPRYGIDLDDTLVVPETNLDDAVSFTKGCYVGQEIIARIKYRGHVAKKITGVMFLEDVVVVSDAKVYSLEDKEIGKLTSVTYSPRLGRPIALALIKYQFLEAGSAVKVISGEQELSAKIADLPFLKISRR